MDKQVLDAFEYHADRADRIIRHLEAHVLEFLDGEDRPPKTVSFAVNKYQGRLHVFGCLPCFCHAVGKEHDHVSSSLGIQIGAADGFGIAIGNHGIGPCGNYKVRIAAGTQRVTYLHAHLLGRNQMFDALVIVDPLRVHLVLNMERRRAGGLVFADCAVDVHRVAVAGVGVTD